MFDVLLDGIRSKLGYALLFTAISAHSQANAETSVTVSTLWNDARAGEYETYGYLASEIVSSLNSIGSKAARWGHDKLDLDNRSPLHRIAYMATAFQAVVRFQWANSIYFGHEFLHFTTADQLGYADHHFEDARTRQNIKFDEAYLRALLNFEIGGPAVSVLQSDHYQGKDFADKRTLSIAAGLNWQMKYSEEWVLRAIAYQAKDAFDAPEFLLNRMYLATYAVGDAYRSREGAVLGDVRRWAQQIDPGEDGDEVVSKVAAWGLAANLMSPAFWDATAALGRYVAHGNSVVHPYNFETPLGSLTWDVPQYLNTSSMTLAPMAYLTAPDGAGALQADKFTVGLGVEFPVIGTDRVEVRFIATGQWDQFELDLGLSGSEDGILAEATAGFKIDEAAAIVTGIALSKGDTLRAARNFPFGSSSVWAGFKISF